jgi:glycosyltransferase involved in cell wall biosynthesis
MLVIFDMNISRISPAGSCVLAEIEGLYRYYDITVVAERFENPCPELIRWLRVPLPRGPVILRYVLFQFFAAAIYSMHFGFRKRPDLIQATQGQFPWCDISYAHFCHKAYLSEQWRISGVSGMRRALRWATHQFNAAMERWAFATATQIVVPSLGLAREIARTYPGIAAKIRPLANPVDLDRFLRPADFDRQAIRAKLNIEDTEAMLLFVALGDFDRKGLSILLEAMSISNAHAKLVVVGGNGGEIARFSSRAESFGIADRVRFVGFQDDVRPYFWAADVFTFPSAYETFCLVAIQAAAAGVPVIATQHLYGVEEFIVDGQSGWLVEREINVWATLLPKVLADRAMLVRMGQSALVVAQSYGREVFQSRWCDLLKVKLTANQVKIQ